MECHSLIPGDENKSFNDIRLKDGQSRKFLTHPFVCMRVPLCFLNCANGTLLPLTVRNTSASMWIRLGKIFSFSSGELNPPNARDHCHTYGCRTRKSSRLTRRICEIASRSRQSAGLGGRKKREGNALE